MIHYTFQNIPDYFRAYQDREWFGYVMALCSEEMDDVYPDSWFRSIIAMCEFSPMLRRYWPQVLCQFMGWLDRHPDYADESEMCYIHGVQSARRAFETFYLDSHEALYVYLDYLASRDHHEPLAIGDIIREMKPPD